MDIRELDWIRFLLRLALNELIAYADFDQTIGIIDHKNNEICVYWGDEEFDEYGLPAETPELRAKLQKVWDEHL